MDVTFFGTRGSCPCAGDAYTRFGGNTSCVLVDAGGDEPIVLDAGTGLRELGAYLRPQLVAQGRPLRGHIFLTHLHYDHLLGLPFFSPLEDPGACIDIYGPGQHSGPLASVIDDIVKPPFFPVFVREFRGEVRLMDMPSEPVELNGIRVSAAQIPHTGTTLGYRIEAGGRSVAYLPDHQAPLDREAIAPSVLDLCAGVDLLIHDAQYDEIEFAAKSDWGHSTVAYAVHVAAEAGVRQLALFHHDPSHDDARLAALETLANTLPGSDAVSMIFAAREGSTVSLNA